MFRFDPHRILTRSSVYGMQDVWLKANREGGRVIRTRASGLFATVDSGKSFLPSTHSDFLAVVGPPSPWVMGRSDRKICILHNRWFLRARCYPISVSPDDARNRMTW